MTLDTQNRKPGSEPLDRNMFRKHAEDWSAWVKTPVPGSASKSLPETAPKSSGSLGVVANPDVKTIWGAAGPR